MIDRSNRWVALALLFLIGVSAPFQFQAVAALAPFLIAEAGLSYTDIGVLSGIFMLPGVILAAPCGPLAARYGDRLAMALGIALMAASSIAFALTDDYTVMLVSRIVGGAGAVAVSVLLPKVVTDWFHGREIATGMAIIASSVGFGIGLATAILPIIAEATSWRIAMHVNAGVAALAIVIVMAVYSEQTAAGGKADSAAALLWSIDRKELVLASLAGTARGLFSAGYAVFMIFVPPMLITRGMPAVEAGLVTSLTAIASLVSVPLGGYLSDRTGKPNYFIYGGSLGATLTCLLVPHVAPAVLWVVLFGWLRGGCTGGIMSLPSRVLRPASRNTGFAVASAVYFACMTACPPIAGWLADATGSTAAPLWFAAALWAAISLVLATFLALERQWMGAKV